MTDLIRVIFVLTIVEESRTASFEVSVFIRTTFMCNTNSLQDARGVTCSESDKISAIVESYFDPEIALLFSGQYVYQFRPETKKLEEVDEISQIFMGVSEKIEAAWASKVFDLYYLYSVNNVYHWNRTTEIAKKYSYNDHITFIRDNFGLELKEHPTCATNVCGINDKCFLVVIFRMQTILKFSFNRTSPKNMAKEADEIIRYPDGSSVQGVSLKNCQGISVNVNLNGNTKYGLLFADKDKLSYWEGSALIFEYSYEKMFKCSSLLTAINIIIFSAIILFAIMVTAGIILYYSYSKRRSTMPNEFRSWTTKSANMPLAVEESTHRGSLK